MNWTEFINERRPDYYIHITSPIISGLIDKILPMGDTFLEYGFGTGYTAIALANKGKKVLAYDNEPGLLRPAISAGKEYFVNPESALEFISDSKLIRPADIVYSQGLLEHFDDGRIMEILAAQYYFAQKAVVFSVPAEIYPQQDFGDERLMDIAAWEAILAPFAAQLKQLYYYERRQHLIGVIRK